MRTIAIINQKGGSGKTTTSVNLAAALAEKKRSVLLIDLDAQASSTTWFGISRTTKGIYAAFVENASLFSCVVPSSINRVDLVPASSWLVGLDKVLAQEYGSETILRHKLEGMHEKKYDYILIDCPPTLGVLTVNALGAVDEVIVPVEARFMALSGLVYLLETIDIIKKRINPRLKVAGIVPCRVDGRTKHAKEIVDHLEKNFRDLLYKTAIRENIRLSEAPSFAKPILTYDAKSKGAEDFRSFAREVIKQEQSV